MRLWPTSGLWRHPDFLRLWTAQAFSAFGSRITRTALPVVAILTIGAEPTEIAVLSALAVAPGVVVGLLVGGRVDRSAKRPLLIGADLVRALLVITVPVAAWFELLTMAQLYVVAAGAGAATTLFQITDNTFLPLLIGKDHLVEGNAKLEATDSIAEIAGPGAAGILIQVLTAPVVMAIDAATYLWSAACLAGIRRSEPPRPAGGVAPSLWSDIRIGVRVGFGDPLVAPTFRVEGLTSFFGGFFLTLYMIFTLETLALDPATVGLVIGAGGAGALAGAMIAGRMTRLLGLGPSMVLALGLGQAAGLLIPLADGPGWFVIACLLLHQLLGDGFLVAYLILSVSLRQTVLPSEVLGRANATLHVLTGTMITAGALVAGPLASLYDVRSAVWVGVLGGLLAPLILLCSPIATLRGMPKAKAKA